MPVGLGCLWIWEVGGRWINSAGPAIEVDLPADDLPGHLAFREVGELRAGRSGERFCGCPCEGPCGPGFPEVRWAQG